jgi:hypothetical protein
LYRPTRGTRLALGDIMKKTRTSKISPVCSATTTVLRGTSAAGVVQPSVAGASSSSTMSTDVEETWQIAANHNETLVATAALHPRSICPRQLEEIVGGSKIELESKSENAMHADDWETHDETPFGK